MKSLIELLLVGTGGAVGAVSRYGISLLTAHFFKGAFPLGTLVSNLLGCFLIGLLIGSGRNETDRKLRLIFGVGFLGALTTFSTFSAETFEHATIGNWSLAAFNIGLNVVFGLVAVFAGVWIGRKFAT